MTMIDCREAVTRMWAYLSRDLDAPDSAQLEQHLGVCRRCCGELEFSRELRAKVAESGAERIPGDVRAHLDDLIAHADGSGDVT